MTGSSTKNPPNEVRSEPGNLAHSDRVLGLWVVFCPDPDRIGNCLSLRSGSPLDIARGTDSPNRFGDPWMSRAPVKIANVPGRDRDWLVETSSTPKSPTKINGTPTTRAYLKHGDILRVGATLFVLDDGVQANNETRKDNLGLAGLSYSLEVVRCKIRALRSIETGRHLRAPIHIHGETGVGKALVARALRRSETAPFVSVNVANIPTEIADAELFGCKRGAFTGADRDRDGYFQTARGGTLFLDEVADLDPRVQTKLLTAVEDCVVRRLGSSIDEQVDVHIVSATNKSLRQEVESGRFRLDLSARLTQRTITIPPLRRRKLDVVAIADAFFQREHSCNLVEMCIRMGSDSCYRGADLAERLLLSPLQHNARTVQKHCGDWYLKMTTGWSLEDDDAEERNPSPGTPIVEPSTKQVPAHILQIIGDPQWELGAKSIKALLAMVDNNKKLASNYLATVRGGKSETWRKKVTELSKEPILNSGDST